MYSANGPNPCASTSLSTVAREAMYADVFSRTSVLASTSKYTSARSRRGSSKSRAIDRRMSWRARPSGRSSYTLISTRVGAGLPAAAAAHERWAVAASVASRCRVSPGPTSSARRGDDSSTTPLTASPRSKGGVKPQNRIDPAPCSRAMLRRALLSTALFVVVLTVTT
eukprot:scaffold25575_cov118-Isochrysis_galbana.AAC.2